MSTPTELNDLGPDDRGAIAARGFDLEDIRHQLAVFRSPPPAVHVVRPCTPGDGIRVLGEPEIARYEQAHARACGDGRFLKFVPASGAASRMFKALLECRRQNEPLTLEGLRRRAAAGDGTAREVMTFAEGVPRFAFREALRAALAMHGLDLDALLARGELGELIDCLVTARGLDYAALPKALITFHRYADHTRTALEEHLVEAAAYGRDARGVCRLHFTVSPEHRDRFECLLAEVRARYEGRYDARFEIGLSEQHPSTDTIAVDHDNHPFRDERGRLLFRPGGHGALIRNLQDLSADLVYLKNIDNVVPDHLKASTVRWKRILGGCAVEAQEAIARHLERVSAAGASADAVAEAARFLAQHLSVSVPAGLTVAAKRDAVAALLNRPLRVCGMVRNVGEPGGGPFWTRGHDGALSLQIVESAQLAPGDAAQQAVFASSTHFNPVDLVCGLRDWRGRLFDLARFVDADAVFISSKSSGGRELKALERPGLWNGAMAHWNTIFVEVPLDTFNPVKTVNDLLRKEHAPAEE